jgi:serine protease
MYKRFALGLLLTLALLVACDESPPNPTNSPNGTPVRGDISGTITFAESSAVLGSASFPDADFVPGEIIVQTTGAGSQSFQSLSVQGQPLTLLRSLSVKNTRLYRAANLDKQGTLELIETLKTRPDVIDAVPNYLFYSTRTPNDPLYRNQWHYGALNLPAAWDKTTGRSAVTVAVIDTGIVPHPDFGSRVLPGYDFVSDLGIAADGDGRDGDPLDPGPYSKTAYHGTHVAGTIGAASNNRNGVAGVDWAANVLPVRALGPSSTASGAVGTLADVTDAARWAAGLEVAGAPANPTPADVINLSLGGNVPCTSVQQQAFNDIIANNTIVVVAAGNSNIDAGSFSPANCDGVIVVGATARDGRRANYSNYGPRIDILAPGGDASNGIWSLGKNDDRTFSYSTLAGTSMASPHIAGVASLMKALQPDISQAQVLQALTTSAQTLNDVQCDAEATGITLTSQDCGAGLVDAARALEALGNPGTPAPTPEPAPTPSPVNLAGTLVFACPSVANNECTPTQQVTVSGQGASVSYSLKNLPAGEYVILAWKDVNGNGRQDAGDIEGVYGDVRFVKTPASRVDFSVSTLSSFSALRVAQ